MGFIIFIFVLIQVSRYSTKTYLVDTKNRLKGNCSKNPSKSFQGADYMAVEHLQSVDNGDPVELKCNSNTKIEKCWFHRPGDDIRYRLKSGDSYEDGRLQCLCDHDDNVDSDKVCGLRINRAAKKDSGEWKCEVEIVSKGEKKRRSAMQKITVVGEDKEDETSAEVLPAVTPPPITPPPTPPPRPECLGPYNTLSQPWRGAPTPSACSYPKCDSNLAQGWYRFQGPAGTHLPITPVSGNACGVCQVNSAAWIENRHHPVLGHPPININICFSWSGNICSSRKNGKAVACRDPAGVDFFLYFLPPSPGCSYGYCGLHGFHG